MKKINLLLFCCLFVIFCNIVVKYLIIEGQSTHVYYLQKKIIALRDDSSSAFERSEQHIFRQHNELNLIMEKIPSEFSFSEYAVKVRALIDKNLLVLEDSLVFSPIEIDNPYLIAYTTDILVKGNYPSIKQFIVDIQNFEGLKHLNSVSMIREHKDSGVITLGLKLSLFLKKGRA